ncbi:MAG: hypothetical protein ROZ09_03755 [Thiobacillus sp.]|jgi:hypothetical protein|uniref:hypothetical protein n=1 Tax=Thiobacillus sp. TaxID=924 RepID=UPI002895027D|nr:hypothetical protein [Thiobacillus sp.]MDT3705918.1 hypothetical protein [Thiobacillus sp.]
MREKGSGTRTAIEHGITLYPRLDLGGSEAFKQAILAGLGISERSRHALSLNQPEQFAVLDVEGFPSCATGARCIPRGGNCQWRRGRFWITCWGGETRPQLRRARERGEVGLSALG